MKNKSPVFLFIILVSCNGYADTIWPQDIDITELNESLRGTTWDFGIALKHGLFRVNLPDDSTIADRTLGIFKTPNEVGPFMSVKSSLHYFENSHKWGFNYEAHYSENSFDRQFPVVGSTNDDLLTDLGTSVKAKHIVLTPILFYRNALSHQKNNGGFVAAFGMGLSYADLDGDIILTELGPTNRYVINEKKFGLGIVMYAEYRHGNGFIRTKLFVSELNNDTYQIQTQDTVVEVGYSIKFNR